MKMTRGSSLYGDSFTYHMEISLVLASVVAWSGTYFLIKKLTKQEPEWSVRLVTAVHASLITLLAAMDWCWIRKWDIEKLGEPNTTYEEIVLCLTLGYFLFDIIWILRYQTEGLTMYFHHSASIICLAVILAKGTSAFEVLVGISGLELTNPCLQARWFLRTYGYKSTWLYTIVELSFMITFIVFRIFYGTYLTCNILIHPKCHLVLKSGTVCLYVVSLIFACQMFTYVNKRYRKSKTVKED